MMKKALIFVVTSLLSVAANAGSKTLICRLSGPADMDIKVESLDNGKEKLSVILYAMDGDTSTAYVNSQFSEGLLSKQLAEGHVGAIVSLSDLKMQVGGIYLDAGHVTMNYNAAEDRYDVLFAAKNLVFQASCQ
ncbi:hypothetical protein EZJ49_10385 [Bdellovibrio bacteriovorus]|uniref:hypothetical protein n=1 Tax=Bdellovibrio bacteriovorus TaxID=959 RepID=UPI0021CF9E72|nr:hypothetical protein [Bdellovibrio bacteriovorus]UXR63482.1 hypothetical protein EZJ49_10385 [Bdellovibrio bacteriovorus]